jgi:adenine-specific DNA-methyltransferase
MPRGDNPLFQLTGLQQHFWDDLERVFPTEGALIGAAVALDAEAVSPWSNKETAMVNGAAIGPPAKATLATLRDLIRAGFDPLGEAFCSLRPPEVRRENGATYTPSPIVRTMVDWAADHQTPGRIVDPGTGSGRFSGMRPLREILRKEGDS